MKAFLDVGGAPAWRLKTVTVLLASLAALAAGCGKANSPAAPATRSQDSVAATPSAPAPAAQAAPAQPVAATSSNDSQQTLHLLNRALMQWMIKNRRHPQNFEDFANSVNFQIPDPPAGKKYSLDGRGFIVLVDNQ